MRSCFWPARPFLLPCQPSAFSRMTRTAESVAEEAESWITPENPSGRPIACRSQSSTFVSSSVAAGEVCQSMHCAAMAVTRYSATTETGAAFAGK
ncbi:hypothetical protein D9M72_471650 [compost metagenome]